MPSQSQRQPSPVHAFFTDARCWTLLVLTWIIVYVPGLFHPALLDDADSVHAEASRAAGFTLSGFTTQSYFLAASRVDHEMQMMAGDDANHFARLANEAWQLMLPGGMGERFKAMAWLRGCLAAPNTR